MRQGIMTKEQYESGIEEFITEEGRVVLETGHGITTEMIETTKCYGDEVACTSKETADNFKEKSNEVFEIAKLKSSEVYESAKGYAAPVLVMCTAQISQSLTTNADNADDPPDYDSRSFVEEEKKSEEC
jgi:hypothetical protein